MTTTGQAVQSIRNFSIIAHIDHGKTTLTDCFLKVTGSVTDLQFRERMMDSNPIEQERGITIKLAPVRMNYIKDGKEYILNLIDTPGHVDFGYEVSRSLAAGEGALLVVDATQGIQAQTLSNYEQARALGLTVIPVINKIDLPSAETDRVVLEIMELCNCNEADIIHVSAKTGLNVEAVLHAIIDKVPPPIGNIDAPLRALLITSHFDVHQGAIALVRIVDGTLTREKLVLRASGESFLPLSVGVFNPVMEEKKSLSVGEVGYIASGLKDVRALKVGDTITQFKHLKIVEQLPGFKEPQPMVFMDVYPTDSGDFTILQEAVEKLVLKDAALTYSGTHSAALGSGLRMGFLGILHAEIVLERLQREWNVSIIATSPSVTYKVTVQTGETLEISSPAQMPDPTIIRKVSEPIAAVRIITPIQYMSAILDIIRDRRGEFEKSAYVGERTQLFCSVPLSELITDFHDVLKSITSGFASLEYSVKEYREVKAVKVTILLNNEEVEPLSFITVTDGAEEKGRAMVKKLKEVLPRQMFEVPIQAAIGGKVIARETLKAFRKDVTAKLYGGDVTRRKKLLSKQAKGKKKMKQIGKVSLDQDVFMSVLKR
ncbi:MAG: translation elongation factor 4 [Microgenomates group bacterium]